MIAGASRSRSALVVAVVGVACTAQMEPEPTAELGQSDASEGDLSILPLADYTVREVRGFRTLWHPWCRGSRADCDAAASAVDVDLLEIEKRVPCQALGTLRTVPIAFSLGLPPREGHDGHAAQYHRSAEWLVANGYDAAREGVVEISDSAWYVATRPIQPAMLLHELAHAYLDRTWSSDVDVAFRNARASGSYDSVTRLGAPDDRRMHSYAMTSAGEYFAETSEAYFWTNDFSPHDRSGLLAVDPFGATMIMKAWSVDGKMDPCPG